MTLQFCTDLWPSSLTSCPRASKSHCAAQHFCLCFRSCDRQWPGRPAAEPAVPSELNHEVEWDSSNALQLGRCITGTCMPWQQWCPGPRVCGSTLLVMLLHACHHSPGIALQALQHFPMVFGLTQAQCIDLRGWKLQNGNQEFGIVAAFARNCKKKFSDDISVNPHLFNFIFSSCAFL